MNGDIWFVFLPDHVNDFIEYSFGKIRKLHVSESLIKPTQRRKHSWLFDCISTEKVGNIRVGNYLQLFKKSSTFGELWLVVFNWPTETHTEQKNIPIRSISNLCLQFFLSIWDIYRNFCCQHVLVTWKLTENSMDIIPHLNQSILISFLGWESLSPLALKSDVPRSFSLKEDFVS